jgi:hypothetical protein
MSRRKGAITLPDIKRHWPHHVALPADKVRGVMNSNIVWSFAATLSAALRPYAVHGDSGSSENDCPRRGETVGPHRRNPAWRDLRSEPWAIKWMGSIVRKMGLGMRQQCYKIQRIGFS